MNKIFNAPSPYHYNYGGLPSEIINLTYDELLEF
jgi:Zn-dependent M16 (insulinase) family peptidase